MFIRRVVLLGTRFMVFLDARTLERPVAILTDHIRTVVGHMITKRSRRSKELQIVTMGAEWSSDSTVNPLSMTHHVTTARKGRGTLWCVLAVELWHFNCWSKMSVYWIVRVLLPPITMPIHTVVPYGQAQMFVWYNVRANNTLVCLHNCAKNAHCVHWTCGTCFLNQEKSAIMSIEPRTFGIRIGVLPTEPFGTLKLCRQPICTTSFKGTADFFLPLPACRLDLRRERLGTLYNTDLPTKKICYFVIFSPIALKLHGRS